MTLPFTNDLAGDPDPWTDLADIEVSNVTTGKQRAMRMRLVKAFGYTDIAQEFSVSNPANVIAANFSDFWARAEQKMLVQMLAVFFQIRILPQPSYLTIQPSNSVLVVSWQPSVY